MAESIQYWATTNAGNANSDPAIASSDTQAPNTVATNIRSIMTALAKARLDVFGGLTAGGTPNALTVTTNQVLLSAQLTGGAALMIKAASTNTSATVTFAPDGLTAAPIKRADGNALAVGSIQAGMFLFLVYNSGTSEWWCLNIAPASAAGSGLASFSAVKSSSQSVSSTTWTQLTFNTLTYNTGSYFSSNAWTPPAGACLLSLNVEMNGIVSGVFEQVAVYKNGSLYKSAYRTLPPSGNLASGNDTVGIAIQDKCSGTDVYTAYVNPPCNATILNSTNTWFMGTLV